MVGAAAGLTTRTTPGPQPQFQPALTLKPVNHVNPDPETLKTPLTLTLKPENPFLHPIQLGPPHPISLHPIFSVFTHM